MPTARSIYGHVQYDYKVEENVPMPPRGKSTGNPTGSWPKYPFPLMNVGESFFVPCDFTVRSRRQGSLKTAALAWTEKRLLNWKFVTRSVEVPSGVRIWRVG